VPKLSKRSKFSVSLDQVEVLHLQPLKVLIMQVSWLIKVQLDPIEGYDLIEAIPEAVDLYLNVSLPGLVDPYLRGMDLSPVCPVFVRILAVLLWREGIPLNWKKLPGANAQLNLQLSGCLSRGVFQPVLRKRAVLQRSWLEGAHFTTVHLYLKQRLKLAVIVRSPSDRGRLKRRVLQQDLLHGPSFPEFNLLLGKSLNRGHMGQVLAVLVGFFLPMIYLDETDPKASKRLHPDILMKDSLEVLDLVLKGRLREVGLRLQQQLREKLGPNFQQI
jgi:hypothetical protein